MKDAYEILGLSKDSDEETLKSRYEELKKKYSEERFLPGDAGNEAARKLMELEEAWSFISADLKKRKFSEEGLGDFSEVDKLIKSGKLDEAQKIMDEFKMRTAEWHYYQSIIYYKREWMAESRAQLAMAVKMDPNNKKYFEALERMDKVMANPKVDPSSFNSSGAHYNNQQADAASALCRCCQIYCCLDCLCSLCCR